MLQETSVLEILKSTITRRNDLTENEANKAIQAEKSTKKSLSLEQRVLTFKIEESGSNLSQGQRQLICISRALINHPKILLMDEATANIDTKTDSIIQSLIRSKFRESSVMTIAHRLNTIIDYDKILFLKDGLIVEQGHPYLLMSKQDSTEETNHFKGLVKEGGDSFFQEMLGRAKASYEQKK